MFWVWFGLTDWLGWRTVCLVYGSVVWVAVLLSVGVRVVLFVYSVRV